jgi:SAM-dependent methyltransferase
MTPTTNRPPETGAKTEARTEVTTTATDHGGSAPDAGFLPLRRTRWYKRVQAWALSRRPRRYDDAVRDQKAALLSPLDGTVVEIGPGGAPNLAFLRPDVRWIGVEPNPFFAPYVRAAAARLGRAVDVRAGTAAQIPLPDGAADAVISTLVLCSVQDVPAALREIRRVLRPGGRFVFIEHVAARERSLARLIQRAVRPLWTLLGDGCHPDRDTARDLQAAGFASVDLHHFEVPFPIIRPHIAGVARNPAT